MNIETIKNSMETHKNLRKLKGLLRNSYSMEQIEQSKEILFSALLIETCQMNNNHSHLWSYL
jgi:hypothetical protein